LHKHLSITDMPLLVTLSSTEIVLISDSLAEMIGCKRTALTSCRLSVFDLFALESLPVILKYVPELAEVTTTIRGLRGRYCLQFDVS
jgi:hypothetical protein